MSPKPTPRPQPATSTPEITAHAGCSGVDGNGRDYEIVPGYWDTISAMMAECLPKMRHLPLSDPKSEQEPKQ